MSKVKSVVVTVEVGNCYACPCCDSDQREPDCCSAMVDINGGSLYDYQTPDFGIADWCPQENKVMG